MRVRPAIVPLCALILGAAGTIAWLGRDNYDPTAGPIDSSQNGLSYAQPVEVGQDFSIGITTLYNRGKKPAVVERVRLVGVTGSLELLGVNTRLFPQGEVGIFFGEFGFPPARYPTKPLADQNLVPVATMFNPTSGDPDNGLELAIGIRAREPGISAYRAVEVKYRVGSREYREVFEANAAHLCAPLQDYVEPASYRSIRDCPPGDLKDKFEDRVLEWPPAASKDAAR
jgi:hypothetical protein